MKRTFTLLAAVCGFVAVQAQQPLTAGNLVIYRVGADTAKAALKAVATPVFIDEHSLQGVLITQKAPLVQSIALPATSASAPAGNYLLTATGNGTTEGQISRSTDGKYLVFGGYNDAIDTSTGSPALTASTGVARVIGTIDQSGKINTSTATTWASKAAPRAIVSTDGKTFFLSSSSAGIYSVSLGDTGTALAGKIISAYNKTKRPNQSPTSRSLAIYNGNLYVTYQSGYLPGGVGTTATAVTMATLGSVANPDTAITVLPGIDTVYASQLPTITKSSPYEFVMLKLKGGDVLYIADDATKGAILERGIQKYSLVNGTWTYNGSIYAAGCRGLTGYNNGDTVALFATSPKKLYGAFDVTGFNMPPFGPMPGDSAVILDTAVGASQFRGVAFTPGIPVITPVSFKSSLAGSLVNSSTKLTWSTATETNTNVFVIEKSLDGKKYVAIGTISAKNASSSYSFVDPSKAQGQQYYRLKVVNKDGSYSYSTIVVINNKLALSLGVFPNPVISTVTISYPQAVEGASLKITSIDGKLIAKYTVQTGATQTSVDVSHLAKSSYLVSYENAGTSATTQFIK